MHSYIVSRSLLQSSHTNIFTSNWYLPTLYTVYVYLIYFTAQLIKGMHCSPGKEELDKWNPHRT